MAIAFVATRSSSAVASPGTEESLVMPTAGSITKGNYLVLFAAYNNSGTAGVDPEMVVAASEAVTASPYYDMVGNYWFRLGKSVRTGGVANDGAVIDVWACRVGSTYTNGDSISVQFAFPTTGFAYAILEYSGVRGISYSAIEPVTGNGNGTSIGGLLIDPDTTGQMVIGAAAVETNAALTGDADAINGSWAALATAAYNSGTDATSMTLAFQTKTVTSPGTQSWTITKGVAADWAAVAVVLDPFVNAPFDITPGNPNEPCIAGPEILPVTTVGLTFDTGTEYLFTHQIPPNSYGSQDYRAVTTFQTTPSNTSGSLIQAHTYAFDLYRAGDELARDPIEVYNGPLIGAGLGGAATVSGSMSEADALAGPGGDHVILPSANDYVDVLFDVAALVAHYPKHRILRWGVTYLAWKDDSSPPTPGEGMRFEWRDDGADNGGGASIGLGYWLVPNYLRDAQYETRWFGEANLAARGKGEVVFSELGWGASFTVNDLSHMDLGDQETRIRIYGGQGEDLLQTDVYLDHIFMVVELVPERRIATGMRRIVTSPLITANTYPAGLASVPVFPALNSTTKWIVPSNPDTYVLAVREALPASPSDYYAVRTEGGRSIAGNEAVGAPFESRALIIDRPTLDPQPTIRKATLAKGRLAGTPVVEQTIYPAVTALDLVNSPVTGSFWPTYIADSPGNIPQVSSAGDKTQVIRVDGGVQYNRIKLLVQPDEMTQDDLEITVEQPAATPIATATISVADALAAPDLGFGWREISVPLSAAVTPSAGSVTVTMSSGAAETAPWYVALGYGLGGNTTYSNPTRTDYAVVLQCTLPTPTVTMGNSVVALFRASERCVEEDVTLPQITVTNGGSYDWISIERTVNGGVSYQPVTMIEVDPDESPLADVVFVDHSTPWDLPAGTIEYRVSGYRDADRIVVQSADVPWNNTVTAPGAAFGLAADSSLLAYIPTSSGGPLEIQWNPLNPVNIVALHGVDYQVVLRAPEERGLAVEVTLLIDKVARCEEVSDFDFEVIQEGPQSMTPTPFEQLRALHGEYVTLVLPGGHTRRVILEVGDMTVTVAKGVYIADIKLTDARLAEVEPFTPTNA